MGAVGILTQLALAAGLKTAVRRNRDVLGTQVDVESSRIPQGEQAAALQQVMQEMTTWLEAIGAGREYERQQERGPGLHL